MQGGYQILGGEPTDFMKRIKKGLEGDVYCGTLKNKFIKKMESEGLVVEYKKVNGELMLSVRQKTKF